jgi:hypothetical protein
LLLSAEQNRNTSSLWDAKAAKSHHSLNNLLNSSSDMIRFRNPFFIITTILCSTWSSSHGQHRLFRRKCSSRQSQYVHPDCHFLRSRRLEEISAFDVQLFLELQFVGESTAAVLETRDISRTVVAHFCSAVQTQVRAGSSRNMKKFDTRRKKRSLKLHNISLFFTNYFCRQLAIS